jgi:hypothetical protein
MVEEAEVVGLVEEHIKIARKKDKNKKNKEIKENDKSGE